MRKLLFMLFLIWFAGNSYAQSHIIKGKVTDDKEDPLPGVTITLKNTQQRSVTNQDGNYTINVVTSTSSILVFSFISFETKEVDITGKNTVDVKMVTAAKDLTEVVVTGLNINRTKASLTSSVQGVNVNEMTEARATNITDLLDGKVAGLQIITSGQPTGSTRVQLRGPGSITGNNQPLWVVDGIPIDNNDSNGQVGNLDYGNNAADLNPDDIESIEVLKGPNAAAIYGSKAANGAILVTTKKGKKNSGLGVSYNGNYMASRVLQFPSIQNVYGEGGNMRMSGNLVGPLGQGVIQAGTGGGRSYGGPLLGQPYLTVSGQLTQYVPQSTSLTSLFQVGGTSSQNISLSQADDKSAVRFSYGRTDATDVIDKQNLVAKNNFQFTASKDFTPAIRIETRVQYIQENVTNRTYRNEDPTNPFNYFNNAVVSIPLSSLIPWKDGNGNAFNGGGSGGIENPYWDINENGNQDTHNTVIGGVTATFKLAPGLQLRAQEAANLLWGNRYTFIQKGSLTNLNGSYNEFQQNNRVWDTQALLMFNKRISNFSVVANAGAELRNNNYYNTSAGTNQLLVHDVRSLSNNATNATSNESPSLQQVQSLFGTASIGYKDFLYFDLTGRNDWSSTLPVQNASFFYPSAGTSFVFTELWKTIPKGILSYGKIRASIARVGNATSPYNLYNQFFYGGAINGVSYVTFDTNTLKNSNLKPEQKTSIELGVELHFLNERVSVTADVYQDKTVNQLLSGSAPVGFGFSNQFINGGSVQNRGFELTLTGSPIKTKSFAWDAVWNFSLNRNKVLALAPGITQIQLGAAVTGKNYAEVGQPLGVIRAEDQEYSSDGYPVIVQSSGLPYYTSNHPTAYTPLQGYAAPRALTSFGSTFRYKNFNFNFLVSSRIGGVLYSGTGYRYYVSGNAVATLGGRDAWLFSDGVLGEQANEQMGITNNFNLPYPDASRSKGSIFPGYYPKLGTDGKPLVDAKGNYIVDLSQPNTRFISPQTYWQQTNHVSHLYVYDASYVKLSQVIVGYNIPNRLLSKTKIKNASISLVGRNIWTIFQKTPKGIDPESAASSGNGQGLEQGGSLPYATYGIDFKVSL
ncbi:MAG: SusC/RagA family TonB-linked outer membrane protein [Bacteroidota bacterium]